MWVGFSSIYLCLWVSFAGLCNFPFRVVLMFCVGFVSDCLLVECNCLWPIVLIRHTRLVGY